MLPVERLSAGLGPIINAPLETNFIAVDMMDNASALPTCPLTPAATSIGFLLNPTDPTIEAQVKEAEAAARTLGMRSFRLR
jgi:hypothetical protein